MTEKAEFGIVVGRFQVKHLHSAHRVLLQEVQDNHERVIVFLGVARPKCTVRNPLDVFTREQMIKETFPDILVSHIVDQKDNYVWVKNLDNAIRELTGKGNIVMYGGRDSCLDIYKKYGGKYPIHIFPETQQMSGTSQRATVSKMPISSEDFRAGVIYSTQLRYPTSYQTVDIACFNDDHTQLLVGRKPNEKQWRFPGGFVDAKDISLEHAARREFTEEACCEITDPVYVWSTRVDDWRYKKETDKILTALFECKLMFGKPTAGDDLEELKWIDLWDKTQDEHIVKFHLEMIKKLRERYLTNKW